MVNLLGYDDTLLPVVNERAIGQKGDANDEDHRKKKIETIVTTTGIAGMLGTSAAVSNESAAYEESSTGLGGFVSSIHVGIQCMSWSEGKKTIQKVTNELLLKNEEYELLRKTNGTDSQLKALYEEIIVLEKVIVVEFAKRAQLIDSIISKASQGGVSTARKGSMLASVLQHGSAATQISEASAMGIGSFLAIVFSSRALKEDQRRAKKIANEKEAILALYHELPSNDQSVQRDLLLLRLKNLDKQEEENCMKTMRDLLTLTSGMLGTVSMANTCLFLGVGSGALLGSATGVGALAFAGTAVLFGSGYFVYRNRECIYYYTLDTKLALQEKLIKKYLEVLYSKQKKIKQTINQLEKQQKNKELDDYYREQLDEIWDRIQELEQNPDSDQKELENLTQRRQSIFLKYMEIPLKMNQLISALNDRSEKRHSITIQIDGVTTRRRRLSDAYKYDRDLSKFSGGVSQDELKMVESKVVSGDAHEVMKDLFLAQTGRINAVVDLTVFHQSSDPEKLWKEVIKGITAPVR